MMSASTAYRNQMPGANVSLQMKLLSLACCALACSAVPCSAQEQPTFKTQAPLVVVPVTVSTKNGERIWDLKKEDFQVLDNGHEREAIVEPWGTYESHVSLVVVVQTSAFSHAAILKIKKTASMLDGIIGDGGEVALITAGGEVTTRLNFSSTWEDIQEAFENLKAHEGGGRVLDGVDAAIAMLSQKPAGQRRIVLALCQARDLGSKTKAGTVLTHAQQQNVTIYSATYSASVTNFTTTGTENMEAPIPGFDLVGLFTEIALAAKQNLGKTLAVYTGGRQLSFETLHSLETDLTEIGKEVHSQYQLSFVPSPEQTPVYHQLSVTIKHHADLVIRARPGYWNGVNQP